MTTALVKAIGSVTICYRLMRRIIIAPCLSDLQGVPFKSHLVFRIKRHPVALRNVRYLTSRDHRRNYRSFVTPWTGGIRGSRNSRGQTKVCSVERRVRSGIVYLIFIATDIEESTILIDDNKRATLGCRCDAVDVVVCNPATYFSFRH